MKRQNRNKNIFVKKKFELLDFHEYPDDETNFTAALLQVCQCVAKGLLRGF